MARLDDISNVFLMINGISMIFPAGWVDEDYSFSQNVQTSTNDKDPAIMTPGDRTLTLTITLEYDDFYHYAMYEAYKGLLISWVKMTQTTNKITNDGKVVASADIDLVGAWRFPIKRRIGDLDGDIDELDLSPDLANEGFDSQGVESLRRESERPLTNLVPGEGKIRFGFIPNTVQVTCGYFGRFMHMALGYFVSITISSNHENTQPVWSIVLMEYDYRTISEVDVT